MALLSLLLLVLATSLQYTSSQDLLLDFVPCKHCPSVTLKHYDAQDCKPVFDDSISECCPASFKCLTEEERGIPVTACVYNNATYEVGDSIPVSDPCSVGCTCVEGFPAGRPAKVECALVECPSLFNSPTPGCRSLYNIDQCCEVDEVCEPVASQVPVITDEISSVGPVETVPVAEKLPEVKEEISSVGPVETVPVAAQLPVIKEEISSVGPVETVPVAAQLPVITPDSSSATTPKVPVPAVPAVVPAVVRDVTKCSAEGKEYQLGEKIYFDSEPCQYCVCTENFTDAFGANCTTVDCHMEYRGRTELLDGCTPIYFSSRCCNSDWLCPDSPKVKPTPEQLEEQTNGTSSTHCSLGAIVAVRDEVLATDDCNLNCVCATPPAFTCVQYSTCDDAAKARKTGVLP